MPDDRAILEVLEAALRERGEVAVPAGGLSMGRRFAACDGLVISRFRLECFAFGRVAVFRCADDRWIAHRVLLRWGGRYLTKGDGLWTLDWPPPRRNNMVGEVVALVCGGKRRGLVTPRARLAGGLRAALGWIEVVAGLARRAVATG